MSEVKLTAVIEAEDRASAVINSVSNKLKDMQPVFKDMAAIGTAAFAGITAGVVLTVKAAEDAQTQLAQFNATMNTMGKAGADAKAQLLELSKGVSKLGFDDEEAANSLAKLYQRTGDVTQANKLLNLSMDLARAKNLDLDTATKMVTLALSGSGRALLQYGIVIKDSATPLEALGILQEKVGGQAIAFSETFAGKMKALDEQVINVKEAIGNAFIPILIKLVTEIQPVVDRILAWSEAHPELIRNIALLGLAISGMTAVVGFLGIAMFALSTVSLPVIATVAGLILVITAVVLIATQFHDKIVEIFSTLEQKTGLISLMKQAWDDIVLLFNQNLMPALQELWKQLEPLKPFFEAMIVVLGVGIVIALGAVVLGIKLAIAIFIIFITEGTKVATWLTEVFSGAINGVIGVVSSAVGWIERMIDAMSRLNIVKGAQNFIGGAVGAVGSFLGINDGIVQNGKIITTNPDDYIIATKTPGNLGGGKNININISGAILNEQAARTIGDLIINDLRLQMRF